MSPKTLSPLRLINNFWDPEISGTFYLVNYPPPKGSGLVTAQS